MTIAFQNRIIEQVWAHPEVARAQQEGDYEKADALLKNLRLPNGKLDQREFVLLDSVSTPNVTTLEGKQYVLDLLGVVASNSGLQWFCAPWSGDVTPDYTWTAAGFNATATEFATYDEATRQQIAFTDATDSGGGRADMTNPVRAQLTITTGVTNQSIYGMAILSSSTKLGTAGKLLAAVRYGTPKLYNAGEVRYVGYQIYIP